MGIQGLSTFLNKYLDRYNDTIYIKESLLVIDGNNLMYFLFSNPPGLNAYLVGGDWVYYAKRVRQFFQHMKDCELIPIVIFDGAHEPEKWKTVIRRYRETLRKNVHSQMPGNSYSPMALSAAFREILVEQRVLHYQTELEADDTMAYIAKKLQCPLLSSDSDFYIYPNVQNIPLGAIDFRKYHLGKDKSGKRHAIAAKVLSLERLCKEEFKFQDLRLIPLAPVILGNDRISTATFANLHKDKATDKFHRIKYVFQWLGKHRDYDHVLTVILQSLKEADRNEMLSLVKSVLSNYQGEHGEPRVWNSLVKDLNLNLDMIDEGLPPQAEDVESLWYLPLHTNSTFPTYLLNILRNRTILLPPQVEISHLPSTHALSLDIIRVTAAILLGEADIILITRERKNVNTVEVTTLTELSGFGPIPTIHDPKFRNKGLTLLQSLFQLSEKEFAFVSEWPASLKFLVSSILYFFKKMSNWNIVRPIAIAVLFLHLQESFRSNQKNVGREDGEALSDLIRGQTSTKGILDFFNHFSTNAFFSKTQSYEISYVYAYCQFQCLLVHSMMLSKLLGNPFRLPRLQYMNSHFVYNVTRAIVQTHHKSTTEFLQLYFGNSEDNKNLLSIFDHFFHVVDHTKKGMDVGVDVPRNAVEAESSDRLQEDTDEEDDELGEGGSEDELGELMSNRFSKLRVD